MSNTGTVQDYKKSESGRTKVKIDGQWYNAGNGVDISANTTPVGSRISFDSSSKDWNGKQVWWLNKYGLLPTSSNGVHADPAPKFSNFPYPTPAAPSQTQAPGMSEGERLCFSNLIGNLAASGSLKTPDEIDLWGAALLAFMRGQSRQPGEDDEKF